MAIMILEFLNVNYAIKIARSVKILQLSAQLVDKVSTGQFILQLKSVNVLKGTIIMSNQ